MIKLIFTCGHVEEMDAKKAMDFDGQPTCSLDGSPLERVEAPKPQIKFVGAQHGSK